VAEPVGEARVLGLTLDLTPAKPILQHAVMRGFSAVAADPTADRIEAVQALIEDATALGLRFGLWQAQNRFFEVWRARPDAQTTLAPLGASLGFNLRAEPK
jgi:hypothetical protein